MSNISIAAIILTYNEEIHLKRCLESLKSVCNDIVIVDSFSNDNTELIAKNYKVRFFQNNWVNYSNQFNWGIENTNIKSDWILRIDADEYLSDELIYNLNNTISKVDYSVNGITLNRLMYFMGKPVKKGGMYPISHLRIWRNGFAYCEHKWMDERIILKSGSFLHVVGDLIDHNLNDITWWINKHNHYATREVIDYLNSVYHFYDEKKLSIKSASKRRNMKTKYNNMPLLLRPFIFFMYRYFFQLGIIEGKRGFIWSILQCFWYRFLIDVKIVEVYNRAGRKKEDIIKYFLDNFNYDITSPSL